MMRDFAGRDLIPLQLPLKVEAQRRDEEYRSPVSPASMGHNSNQDSQSSTVSDMSLTPSTPSGSLRGHSRLTSSTSSLPSSPLMRESFEGFASSRRPLTDVKEDPQERDEDVEMGNGIQEERNNSFSPSPRTSEAEWTFDDPRDLQFLEYDLADDSDFSSNPTAKRQRAENSPFNGIAARIGAIKPSFSRKWKSRKASPTITTMPGVSREPSLSRANSSRAPSVSSATMESNKAHAYALPPTPTRSALDESFEDSHSPFIDVDRANDYVDEDAKDQAKPTTPLLPPLMTAIPDHIKDVPYQSPLQSPAVADPSEDHHSRYTSPHPTPQLCSLPSPPLSTRPSIASFRARAPSTSQRGGAVAGLGITHQGPLIPSSEIPPHPLSSSSSTDPTTNTDPSDHWADALGHANFTIQPTPYQPPAPVNAPACKQLRADWDAARAAYAKHLSRTGEHYGPTSKTFRLTEEKWVETDKEWQRCTDAAVAAVVPSTPIFSPSLHKIEAAVTTVEAKPHPPLVKMPSLNGPRSEGKFPGLPDEGIVGMMEVAESPLKARLEALEREQWREGGRKRKRKWGVLRWVQGVFGGVGGE